MSMPSSLRAYEDCRDLFNAAVADPKGARGKLGTYNACINMRTRMHYFRDLERRANAQTYPEGHPSHGTSVYDPFVVQILKDEDGEYWLYVQPRSTLVAIEGLSEVGDLIDVEGDEVILIEDKSGVVQ